MDPVIAVFNDGVAKINAGDFKTAIADFEEVLVLAETVGEPANDLKAKAQAQLPVLHYQVANAYIKQKKYEEAIPSLEKTIELSELYGNSVDNKAKALKYLPALLTGVGTQKYKDKDLPAALKNFDEAIKYDPTYGKAYLGKGIIFADQFKAKEMEESLTKAIELSKSAGDAKTAETAQIKLGAYYINQGNLDLADVDPEDEDYTDAIYSFEKAISYNPAATDAFYMLAVIWNKSLEFDKAIENGKKALESETDPTKIAAINYELGNGYVGIAEYVLACEALNKAMVEPFYDKAVGKKEKVPGCQ
jgi:tetratricopeptide (TPR) repeat protein